MSIAHWLLISLIPVSATVIGCLVAARYQPGPLISSAIQHFAAGVVFAAAAGEVLPELKHGSSVWSIAIGGGIGIATMLTLEQVGKRVSGAAGVVALVALDLFIDGLVLGLGFAGSAKAGILLTFALTLEVLFLGLSLSLKLRENNFKPTAIVAMVAAICILLPLGTLSAGLATQLPTIILSGFFAFALVSLLYLVTEELLVEAHESGDAPWVAAMFFVGFLLLLILDALIA
ncbi:MAG TPA: transporter [Hyphomicrobium sp.]|nr:transporter [Hyphomicrobium sp.]